MNGESETFFQFHVFVVWFIIFITMFLLGVKAGEHHEKMKWKRNANDYKRIESDGVLYKVLLARDYTFLEHLKERHNQQIEEVKPNAKNNCQD